MNPDAYMPYYGNDFEAATKGMRREVKWSYLAACWHYWHHTHCAGLPDNDDYLQAVCDCPVQDWMRTKGMIFGTFFKLADGVWHQKRTAGEYAECKQAYESRVAGAAKARSLKIDTNPDIKDDTKADIKADIKIDTNPDSKVDIGLQSESESESFLEREKGENPKGIIPAKTWDESAEIPTVKEVIEYGGMVGVTQESAKRFFDHYEGHNLWLNKFGRMVKWKALLVSWDNRGKQMASRPLSAPKQANGAELIIRKDELRRCEDKIGRIRGEYETHMDMSEKDRAEVKRLKARVKELKDLLGMQD